MRLEYKYLVRNSELDLLRKEMAPYLKLDTNYNEDPEYTVRSIYFDTSKLQNYHEKIEGINIRKKLRIRGYNLQENESIIFLEIKRKHENYINKNRSALKYYHLDDLIKTKNIDGYVLRENGFSNSVTDAEKFLHHIYKGSLKPIVLIVYEREAFYSKFDDRLRITYDKNLRYALFPSTDKLYSDDNLRLAIPNNFILEVKFSNGFPIWLKNILTKFNLSRMALSKYTICLEKEKVFNPIKRKSIIGLADSFSPFHSYYGDDDEI